MADEVRPPVLLVAALKVMSSTNLVARISVLLIVQGLYQALTTQIQ